MAEIVPVVSEALEAQIRDLLPSQRGFGEDLQASNVITPIIDLTAAAQGTTTPEILQTALAFGSQTNFSVANTTTTIITNTGFYRITGGATLQPTSSSSGSCKIIINDGLGDKTVWESQCLNFSGSQMGVLNVDYVVFLRSGDSCKIAASGQGSTFNGSSRQIADVNGTLVNPVGFTPQ